ncbi:hypothetical protein NKR19_g6416 [Coniochaeta hoffmannii]|uniref:Uncharacterized protein n=1 Tax=Coniochaeta hoffmannii TaxID=91930 RepID=A0AA38VEK5_9PEZI|nr:hypothetical protein NKR19_g6416 [Coniochaeta hoffmannii]
MAPAIQADVPFHRSHSTPDLLSGLPNRPSTVSIGSPLSPEQQSHRTLSLKSLPSLPAFDVPSIDLDFEFDDDFKTSLRFDTTPVTDHSKPAADDKSTTAAGKPATTALTQVADFAKPEKSSKKKSMLERRRWLPSSKSSPDDHGIPGRSGEKIMDVQRLSVSIALSKEVQQRQQPTKDK